MEHQWILHFAGSWYGPFETEEKAKDYAYRELMWDTVVVRLVKP